MIIKDRKKTNSEKKGEKERRKNERRIKRNRTGTEKRQRKLITIMKSKKK